MALLAFVIVYLYPYIVLLECMVRIALLAWVYSPLTRAGVVHFVHRRVGSVKGWESKMEEHELSNTSVRGCHTHLVVELKLSAYFQAGERTLRGWCGV